MPFGQAEGYLAAVSAACFFGLAYVPVKTQEIHDGTVFQWFMCSGVLFAGVLLGLFLQGEVPRVILLDLLGGVLWSVQNMLLIPVVKKLGLGIAFAIYSGATVLSGYVIGRLGLFGTIADAGAVPALRDTGAVVLVASFSLMAFVRPSSPGAKSGEDGGCAGPQGNSAMSMLYRFQAPEARRSRSCPDFGEIDGEGDAPLSPLRLDSGLSPRRLRSSRGRVDAWASQDANQRLLDAESVGAPLMTRGTTQEVPQPSAALMLLAVALCVLAGFLNSMSILPFNWWEARNPLASKGSFIFAQALSIWMMSTMLYISYASTRKVLKYRSPPHSSIRPAFVSGLLWAMGFVCSCIAIDRLGFTAGFTYSSVLPVLVSSLMSVLWFREIQGRRQISIFVACFLVQTTGVCLIALGSH